jgi:hypothetical protein
MFMKRIFAALVLAGAVISGYATDSRILALGKHDGFFMDDYSVFRNPANVNVFPNMLLGTLGEFRVLEQDTATASGTNYAALKRENRDPTNPYAAGIISYSFNESSEAGSQFPMLSFGIGVNRPDKNLEFLLPTSSTFAKAFSDSQVSLPEPVGRFDFMLGYALQNGGMIGVSSYMAFQKGHPSSSQETEASLYRWNIGLNWPAAKSTDFEASVGISAITAKGLDTASNTIRTLADFSKNRDFIADFDLRLFTALTIINGDLVPRVGVQYVDLTEYASTEVAGGIGVNLNVDKGFGWGGLEFIFEDKDFKNRAPNTSRGFGGRLSFGFERNLIWDWFLLRTGMSKRLLYVTEGTNSENGYWDQNVVADASDDDMAGIGIGFNIENRLKIDIVLAEDVFFTLTNLISGPQHHIFPKFTASYSF